jgi:hypothetical protein
MSYYKSQEEGWRCLLLNAACQCHQNTSRWRKRAI